MPSEPLHPNVLRLSKVMREMRFGRITEIQVADGIPIKFRVEQLVDISRGELPYEATDDMRGTPGTEGLGTEIFLGSLTY